MVNRRWFASCLFVFLLIPSVPRIAFAEELTVMTRNLYIGADLGPLLSAETTEDFIAAVQEVIGQVTASNFPERAWEIATEIVEKNPHLVGLQEAYNFKLNGSNGPVPFRDYLEDLLGALAAQGADYRVAAVVTETDLQIPFGGNLIGATDRDIILARSDVVTSVVPLGAVCAEPSGDGCNYQVVASVNGPIGEIKLERGFLAVDATAGSDSVRLVNTHLEQREFNPAQPDPMVRVIQSSQAFELISILAAFPNPLNLPVIVVGDTNSSPLDQTVVAGPYIAVPPYMQFVDAGYIDAWALRPGRAPGLTCCQDADLLNPESNLYERVDHTFLSEEPIGKVKVNDVGNDETDKTPSGLWPSDHAGVVSRFKFAQ